MTEPLSCQSLSHYTDNHTLDTPDPIMAAVTKYNDVDALTPLAHKSIDVIETEPL